MPGPSASGRPARPAAKARSSRPGEGRAGVARDAAGRESTPPGLSRRAAVLLVLILGIATALAPFVHALVQQETRIAALREEVEQSSRDVDELRSELDRWDDPAFVKAQARQRFTYVMPGEVGYVVLDGDESADLQADPGVNAAREASSSGGSWFGTLWGSVEVAGSAPVEVVEDESPDEEGSKPAPDPDDRS